MFFSIDASTPRSAFYPLFPALLATLLLPGCGDNTSTLPSPPPPSVSVVEVENVSVGQYREFVARTEASQTVDLKARVEGYLTKREFIEGDHVEEGQLLFEIDREPLLASQKQAEAELESQQALLTRAKKALERGRELTPHGYISQSDMDKLVNDYEQALAGTHAAEASLKSATINLDFSQIHAPFSGQISRANYSIGNLISPNSDPLATIYDLDPIHVNFQVEEELITSIRQQISTENKKPMFNVSLRLPNNAVYELPGTIDFSDTKVDPGTGSVTHRSVFANPNQVLLPGLFVTLILETKETEEHPLIPQAAVQQNQQGAFVLVVNKENLVTPIQVNLGRRIGPMWVVESGLTAGQKVVVEGLQKVRAGIEVSPVDVEIDQTTGAIKTLPTQNNQVQ